jgi:hypothetical protein
MDECPANESLLARTTCILTYSGEVEDIRINYVTLCLTLLVAVARAKYASVQIPETARKVRWLLECSIALIGVTLFQITLCWILGCAGISIIWCSLAGWTINERWCVQDSAGRATTGGVVANQNQIITPRKWMEICEDVVLTVVLVVLVYYAIESPLITSVAHVCALLLGTILSRMLRRSRFIISSHVYEALTDSNMPQR